MSSYRLNEGLLTVESGPNMDMSFTKYRVQYSGEERVSLYPGLEEYKLIRSSRDIRFGAGASIDDPLFIERQRQIYEF
ncbi:hypothetical protein D3C85_1750540 [compost metagenome]